MVRSSVVESRLDPPVDFALKEKFPMCNLYIMGHNHVKIGTTTEGIDFRKN